MENKKNREASNVRTILAYIETNELETRDSINWSIQYPIALSLFPCFSVSLSFLFCSLSLSLSLFLACQVTDRRVRCMQFLFVFYFLISIFFIFKSNRTHSLCFNVAWLILFFAFSCTRSLSYGFDFQFAIGICNFYSSSRRSIYPNVLKLRVLGQFIDSKGWSFKG